MRTMQRGLGMSQANAIEDKQSSGFQKALDFIERVGNKVPHPAVIFVVLIGVVMVLSAIFGMLGTSVTFEQANPLTGDVDHVTATVRSLLDAEGLQFVFTSPVANFSSFQAVGIILLAMMGVGVAEEVGLISALIRKLVAVTPRGLITATVVLLGLLSSIATDAGYLVLIPLGAAIFASIGRHPLAGLAAAFAGVSTGFAVNILVVPLDGMLVEITNEAIHMIDPSISIGVMSNFWFELAAVVLLTVLFTIVTDKFVEPRLGAYEGGVTDAGNEMSAEEKRGLKYAGWATLVVALGIVALGAWPNAPLWGFMLDSLIFIIMLVFLIAGAAYGVGAGKVHGSMDVINPIVKTFASLASLIFTLFFVAQFIAFFNYSNLATVAAVNLGDWLETLGLSALPLLLGLILVLFLLDFVIPGSLPKWAIFAPIFVPLFIRLGVAPEAVLAAYRVGDSPINTVTPLMPYFALIVTFAERYAKNVGIGTIIATMVPYTIIAIVGLMALFSLWQIAGIPWGF